MRSILKYLSFGILLTFIISSVALAAGGDEKESDKSDSDKSKQATEAYNSGVKHMSKGNETAAKGDSAFAYNYRATSNAKANKEYEKAVEKFEKAVSLDPKMKEAHNNLGYCYRKLGKLEQSLTSYQAALEIDPNYAQAREYLGETYLAMGEMDKAIEQYNKLKEMESPYADTLNMAIELYKLKEIDKQMQGNASGM